MRGYLIANYTIDPTVGLGPNGLCANLREAHFAVFCPASPISPLATEKRTVAVGLKYENS